MQSTTLVNDEYAQELNNVSVLLQQSNKTEDELKHSIINLANILEKSYLSVNNITDVRHIYSIICMALKSKNQNLSNYYINKKVFQALEKYPQFFTFTPEQENEETEENRLFADLVTEYTRKISKIQISRLNKAQAEHFIKYLDKISRAKINEAKHEYDISLKDIDKVTSPLDELDTDKINTKRETDTAQMDEIFWKLREFRDLINTLLTHFSAYYHAPAETIKGKMLDSLQRSIERLQLIIDMKDKATFEDWSNISLISNEYKVNAGRLHKFKTSYCKNCKDINSDLDPEGKKKIYAHMEMKKEYTEIYDPNLPYREQPIYIWRCPKCKGTEQLEISLTAERIKSNYRHVIEINTEHINEAGFDNFAEVFGKSCVQVFKINSSKDISNKLLSKK